jgi:cell division protein FtsB
MARKKLSPERRRRRRRIPILLKIALIGALTCVAVVAFAIGNKIVRPFHLWFVEKHAVSDMQAQLNDMKHENAELRAKREYLKSPAGAENEARRLGYVAPGEVSLVVEPPKPKSDGKADE